MAVFIPKILVVIAYAGAGPGACLVYLLPALMVFNINRKRLPWSHPAKWTPFLLLVMSVVLMLVSLLMIALNSDLMANVANVTLVLEGDGQTRGRIGDLPAEGSLAAEEREKVLSADVKW